ncbi:hypothetical protein [Nitrosomonas communis]|uniref:CDP-Glycerol:Poly(Glycerophosphate) glycerophosphotransferase n=1 Tax=Nitrosomonas communis TaxID=44574 RepID=A0A1H2XB08_9PROT|nr:hypothetical protein [Nitrosomonas communis]SDW89449.1 hypothetical protein SAMN05421882_103618 [Nitrosomonas communis]
MKALFFLRHYNDIDHITPVISKWIESGHTCDVILIGHPKFRDDYRIQYLASLAAVRVAHIRELLPALVYAVWRMQTLLLSHSLRRSFIGPFAVALCRIFDDEQRGHAWRSAAHQLLRYSFVNLDKGVVVFDWITKNSPVSLEWVETVVSMAHTMGLGTVSLPHGDSPHANELIRRGEWDLQPNTLYSSGRIFDKLVVPNELCAKRFSPFMADHLLEILGSPRYCDEWLARLKKLLPPAPLTGSSHQLKIAMFLRKDDFTIFWEEVSEVIRMIATFPEIVLVIKPHTRGGWKQSLTKDASLRYLPNVSIAGDAIHSVHLMNWADVIIDLATSVVFEAIKAKKPVLAADYLHAGRSAVAEFIPETELRCRDDVYQKINKFLSHGCSSFYVEEHRQRFIKEMIDGHNVNVLPRYVSLLETQAQIRSVRKDKE